MAKDKSEKKSNGKGAKLEGAKLEAEKLEGTVLGLPRSFIRKATIYGFRPGKK